MVNDEIENLMIEISIIETQMKSIEDKRATLRQKLLQALQKVNRKNHKLEDDNVIIHATTVNNSRVSIDEVGLLNTLSSEQYELITEKKVNRKLLERAIKDSLISEEIAVKHLKVEDKGSYIKIKVDYK